MLDLPAHGVERYGADGVGLAEIHDESGLLRQWLQGVTASVHGEVDRLTVVVVPAEALDEEVQEVE